jgi:DNA polymerase-1
VPAEIADYIEELSKAIFELRPRLIMPLGKYAFWAVAGIMELGDLSAINDYRGSVWRADDAWVVPSFAPAHLLRVAEDNWLQVVDVKRAVSIADLSESDRPNPLFHIATTFQAVKDFFEPLEDNSVVSADVETRSAFIDCIGFASATSAICIPFVNYKNENIWTEDEEVEVVLYILQQMRRVQFVGQNWHYDAYCALENWGALTIPCDDTMVMHHCAWPGTDKSLGFLSSIYVKWHTYWKGGLSESSKVQSDSMRWLYNAQDCFTTRQVWEALKKEVVRRGVEEIYRHEMRMWLPLLQMMWRGFRIDESYRKLLTAALKKLQARLLADIEQCVGYPLNPGSSTQMAKLFLEELGLKPATVRGTLGPSFKEEVMHVYTEQAPALKGLFTLIAEYRSVGTTLGHVLSKTDPRDGRMRTNYNLTGTITGRLSSSQRLGVYGKMGMNMQNVTDGREL